MNKRLRRLRSSPALRDLVRETRLTSRDLIQPFFVVEGQGQKQPVPSMPGIYRYSVDTLLPELERYQKNGGVAGLFFGVPNHKDEQGSGAWAEDGVIQEALKAVKKNFPDFLLITDVCLCAYTSHGHCGVFQQGRVDNDQTLPLLARMALSHARAGADMVAPSDMMDFRVSAIRQALDQEGLTHIPIMSYAAKYASAFYGPFRDAAHSGMASGDRKTYQMDCGNQREAEQEALLDSQEGADIVMVKPALAYLDIIHRIRQICREPIAAYSVSGEYSMIKAAARKKWIQERDVVEESLLAMKRAGADLIITYHAEQFLKWNKSSK